MTLEIQTCSWKRCKETIKVNQMKSDLFHVIGWCKFHEKVYSKLLDLFRELGLDSNDVWLTDRRKYNSIQRSAVKKVKEEEKKIN